jgi:signal transduction histidine kinase
VGTLYGRIYLHFLGVLLVVGLAAGLVFAVGQRGAFQRQVTERLARHLGTLVAETLPDRALLAHRLEQLRTDLGVDVTVRDKAGELVLAAGPPLRRLSAAEVADLRAGALIMDARRGWFVTTVVGSPTTGDVLGFVEVSVPGRLRPPGPWRPVFGLALVLVIVAVTAAPLARRISRPIERLTEGARRLGAGDLSYRVPVDERAAAWRHGRRRAAHELGELTRAFNDMAERVERLLHGQKELLANVSHELRSPLARIRVALALLPRGGEAEARLRDVEADLAELDGLIEAVLTTARLDATGLPPSPESVDVAGLLAEIAERAAHDPATTGIPLEVTPGAAPDLVADRALLRRALWNLVENAAKYGAPPITLGAACAGDRVVLSVTDQGEGIAAAERERVLAPFYRLDQARTPHAAGGPPRGFGLGLTLARRVAEVHGGRITIGPAAVGGEPERGCRVALELPGQPPPHPRG